jgi:hypothetical protein
MLALLFCPDVPWFMVLGPWLIGSGLLLVGWSFQFPRVAPVRESQEPKRFQFSLRTLLAVPLMVAVYMVAVVWMSDPNDGIAWRLAQPIVRVLLFGCAAGFVGMLITLVVVPIRLAWSIATRVLFRSRDGCD